MYLDHFQLDDPPFGLTPNLAYRIEDAGHAEARATVRAGLEQGAGFIKVTGEVGLGKTLLCRQLLEDLDEPWVSAWLPDPHLSPGTLRTALARDFGITLPARPTQQEVHALLQEQLAGMVRAGRRPVLLIDEAQALPDNTLETVRLLTNLETERRKLLQVVLIGQPELDRRLASERFRQLRQRIVHSCHLEALDAAGVRGYIEQRLAIAGARSVPFTPAGLRLLARASRGVPRVINILADKSLLAAYGSGRAQAGYAEVRRAIGDTEATRERLWWPRIQPYARAAVFSALALGVFAILEFWRGGLP